MTSLKMKPLTKAQVMQKRKALSAVLLALRKGADMTQEEVAVGSGLTRVSVKKAESASGSYQVDTLIRVCHLHGIDLATQVDAVAGKRN